ncbi:MAG: hypothetical protein IPH79_12330 [Sphingomonadales bacterium]|nr:hypothetical protein [Sphingomonadales bacterium]
MPIIQRQALAVVASSVVTSISTLMLFMAWGVFESDTEINWHSVPRDFAILLAFVVPIAAAGITFFGLPLLFIVRRLGWISTINRFRLFGAVVGAFWAVAVVVLFELRWEGVWFMILIGSVNGLVVASLWLNIVEKHRASQRHQTPTGEIS